MNSSRLSFREHWKAATLLCLLLVNALAVFVLFKLPFFIDTPLDLVLFCFAIPMVFGIPGAVILMLVQRLIASLKRVEIALITKTVLFLIVGLFSVSLILYARDAHLRAFKVKAKVFVFGIDGATWTVINPLIEKGRLPNFATLKKKGSYASLKSMEPILSPLLWTTIATGKINEKHGIKDFYSTQDSLRTKRVWDQFEAHGMRVGVFKWLVTWPPRKVNGFMIPDILARDPRTYPLEYSAMNSLRILEKSSTSRNIGTYLRLFGSLASMGLRMSSIRETASDFVMDWIRGGDAISQYPLRRKAEHRMNKDFFRFLLKQYQPQFVTFYDNGVDVLSHKYWRYFEPQYFKEVTPADADRYGQAIPGYYEFIDRTLGELLQCFDENTLVVIVSDHGLQAAGKTGGERYKPKLANMLAALGLDSIVYQITLGNRCYIRLKDPTQTNLLAGVNEKLNGITVVETGEKLFDITKDSTGLLAKFRPQAADFKNHVQIGGSVLTMEEMAYKQPPASGSHTMYGIFAAKGPNVRSNFEIQGASILDVTPTILYLQNLPISKEVDGKILDGAVTEQFKSVHTPQFLAETDADRIIPKKDIEFDAQVEEQLKALGYVQ